MRLLCLVLAAFLSATAIAAPPEPAPLALTESLGPEIDASEQIRYHLFPDVRGLVSARLMRSPQGDYRLCYVTSESGGERERQIGVSPRVIEETRLHAQLVERYQSEPEGGERVGVSSCAKRAFLLLASRGEYDAARRLADAALHEGEADSELVPMREMARQLAASRGLFLPGSLYDQSGRTELLVFSGYYGLWLGIATPVALKADDAAQVGVSLLVIPAASVLVASRATRHANMSDGRVGMITLGGHLGTWQGIGWSAYTDRDGHEAVGVGAIAGFAGVGMAALLTRSVDVTPGHAEIANSGLPWGAWVGAVCGVLADHDSDETLRDMLIGSDAGVLAGYLAGRNSPVSRTRVRVCNMAGVVGAVCGLGLDLILGAEDEDAAIGMAAAGSLAGLYVGTRVTRHMDNAEGIASLQSRPDNAAVAGASASPRLTLYSSPTHPRPTPSVEVSLRF